MTAVEAYLMELVSHTRWLTNVLLSQTDDAIRQRYPRDIESAKKALYTLSRTYSFMESIAEIPEGIVATLAEGALYLLVAETVLGHCPPTMHAFLQQTTLQREQSSTQAQLLLLRWLLTAGIIQIDEILEMVFDSEKKLEDFSTDYDAHIAIAEHLAQADPFFLGAHVLIVRGLLLHSLSETLTGDDVVSHVSLLTSESSVPIDRSSLHTIEDALLLWLRTTVNLFSDIARGGSDAPHVSHLATEVKHIDDLYLHTNDGRVLAIVINHYQPQSLPLERVHLAAPLTVWQRQDNWNAIITAAEQLGVWVGVFPDELVAHGFSTLQLHVLRLVEDLFLVLASTAEREYETIRDEIQASARQSQSVEDSKELDGCTTFVDKNVLHSMMVGASTVLPQPSGLNTTPRGHGYETFQTTHEGSVFDDGSKPRERLLTASSAATSTPPPGEHPTEDHIGADPDEGDLDDNGDPIGPDVSEQNHRGAGEDFNIVMTGLFLQGVSMPIRRQVLPETLSAAAPTKQDDPVTPAPLQDQARASSSMAVPPPVLESYAAQTDPSSEEPHRSDSPVLVTRSMEIRRKKREDNAVASSVAHFKAVRDQTSSQRGALLARNSIQVVQGSIDHEGIEALLTEIMKATSTATTQQHTAPIELRNSLDLREQNHHLRWALEEQKRRVSELVSRLRKSLKRHEFQVIVKHLKQHRGAGNKIAAIGPRHPRAAATDPLRMSFAAQAVQVSIDGRVCDFAAEITSKALRQSIETNHRGKIVVTGAGTQVDRVQVVTSQPTDTLVESVVDAARVNKGGMMLQFSTGELPKAAPKNNRPLEHLAACVSETQAPKADLASLQSLRNKTTKSRTERAPSLPDASEHINSEPLQSSLVSSAPSASALPVVKTRGNRSVLNLALKHVLLTGTLNKAVLEKVLKIVDDHCVGDAAGAAQFVVSFKDEFTQQFKGLYVVRSDAMLQRIYGAGPAIAYAGPQPHSEAEVASWTQGQPYLFPKFFKFDSGSKTFQLLPSKWVNQAADGVAFSAAKPKMMDRERW